MVRLSITLLYPGPNVGIKTCSRQASKILRTILTPKQESMFSAVVLAGEVVFSGRMRGTGHRIDSTILAPIIHERSVGFPFARRKADGYAGKVADRGHR